MRKVAMFPIGSSLLLCPRATHYRLGNDAVGKAANKELQ